MPDPDTDSSRDNLTESDTAIRNNLFAIKGNASSGQTCAAARHLRSNESRVKTNESTILKQDHGHDFESTGRRILR
jgi:hypothetical protein